MAAISDPLSTPTRIALAGDWHMNESWPARAVHHAHEQGADRIVHVGDFGYLFYPRFLRPLNRALEDTDTDLLFIDGNHDDHRYLKRLPTWKNGLKQVAPRIWYVPRGTRWEWDGIRFLALGGAHSVDRIRRLRDGDAWWPEERITAEQAAAAIAGGPADVMVTHDCPAGVDIPNLADNADWFPYQEIATAEEHRRLLRTVVDAVRPASLWHGHYHRFYSQRVDFGWPMQVVGLDMDASTMAGNVFTVDLDQLRPAAVNAGAGR